MDANEDHRRQGYGAFCNEAIPSNNSQSSIDNSQSLNLATKPIEANGVEDAKDLTKSPPGRFARKRIDACLI